MSSLGNTFQYTTTHLTQSFNILQLKERDSQRTLPQLQNQRWVESDYRMTESGPSLHNGLILHRFSSVMSHRIRAAVSTWLTVYHKQVFLNTLMLFFMLAFSQARSEKETYLSNQWVTTSSLKERMWRSFIQADITGTKNNITVHQLSMCQ